MISLKKSKLPRLDYAQQNHIQDIATAHGVILTYQQMQQFAQYRANAAFSKTSDKQILYVVMTPTQRQQFDRTRF